MATKRKWAPTPVLRRGTYTAKQVLEKVIRIIEEEPKRLKMTSWQTMLHGERNYLDKLVPKAQQPKCGTVCCVAGWVNVVTRQAEQNNGDPAGAALRRLALVPNNETLYDPRAQLQVIFYRTKLSKASVIKHLKAYVTEHKEVLTQRKVVVS